MAVESVFIHEGIDNDRLAEIDAVNSAGDKTVRQVLESFGAEIIIDLQNSIDRKGLVSSGQLKQNINYRILPIGGGMEFNLFFATTTKDNANYWKAVDEGRGAGLGFPHVGSLRDWVRQKIAFGSIQVTGKVTESKINGIAYVIGRKIQKDGTKPTNFYSSVVTPKRIAQLREDISKASKNEAQLVVSKIAKDNFIDAFKGKAITVKKV